jgi:hypothetical protein
MTFTSEESEGTTIFTLAEEDFSAASSLRKIRASLPLKYQLAASLTSLMASASPSAGNMADIFVLRLDYSPVAAAECRAHSE